LSEDAAKFIRRLLPIGHELQTLLAKRQIDGRVWEWQLNTVPFHPCDRRAGWDGQRLRDSEHRGADIDADD
jgi:hypothetical protein